jgi:capsule biosynthesis phosphatase
MQGIDMKRIVCDIDGTICTAKKGDYAGAEPNEAVIAALRGYKAEGFEIVLFTSRNMRTYACDVGKIAANTLPVLLAWLKQHDVPFDAIHVGKPWCGIEGFYVDDKAIRPDEFINLSYEEIRKIVGHAVEE